MTFYRISIKLIWRVINNGSELLDSPPEDVVAHELAIASMPANYVAGSITVIEQIKAALAAN